MSDRNKKILIGGAIVIILLLFWRQKKTNLSPIVEKEKSKEADKTQDTQTKIDLSEVPEQCKDGFELDGINYAIKDNKFVKS